MVEHMEKRYLPERHAQEEEPRVKELPKLLGKEHPEHMRQETSVTIVITLAWNCSPVAHEIALNRPGRIHDAPNDVPSKDHAREIVQQENTLERLALERNPSMSHVLVQEQCETQVEYVRTDQELPRRAGKIRLLASGYPRAPKHQLL